MTSKFFTASGGDTVHHSVIHFCLTRFPSHPRPSLYWPGYLQEAMLLPSVFDAVSLSLT